ncbi:Uncharacterised protein [uncultured archaeon]|nr:Uncharacterised protein [uncultured archaeon]
MAETVLGGVLGFFRDLGVYDVLLPFILVFTITFAILERTKLFGTELDSKKEPHTKKNLNAMVAFVVAFLVVASSKLVQAITKISSEIVVLLLLLVFFLMLVGAFYSKEDIEKKGVTLEKGWRTAFMFVMAVAIIIIFLDAVTAADGRTWLEVFWDWLSQFYTNAAVAAIVLIVAVILFMYWIMKEPKKEEESKGG